MGEHDADGEFDHLSNEELSIIVWFGRMSTVNQFAAAHNPRQWAEVQAPGLDGAITVDELEQRAEVWRAHLESLV